MEGKEQNRQEGIPLQFCKNKTKRRDKSFNVYIKTFGCQMNKYDSEILEGLLKTRGFTLTPHIEYADIALFNTCSVREHAERRVYGQVNMLSPQICSLGKSKRGDNYPNKRIIGVIGCMAQAHKEKIFDRLPQVDLVCGPQNLYNIPDYLEDIAKNNKRILAVDRRERPVDRENFSFRNKRRYLTAYVTIMEGCNNFCSYCIVPFVRGREVSRPPSLIIKEIEVLIKKGAKEVTLLGQNVNSYGKDFNNGYNFIQLLKDIDKMHELRRLRFITSHPKDASDEMFIAMSKLPTVCESLHLPIQSGSDKILKSMNRKYTREDYLRKVDILRKLIPEVSLATDIIVGFPNETDEDFAETIDIMKRVQFDTAYIFKYSPRPYTQAARLEDNVPKKVKEERHQELLRLQKNITLSNNKKLINRKVGVLVESADEKGDYLIGRSRTDKVVIFKGPKELIGKIVEVRIIDASLANLKGEWIRL